MFINENFNIEQKDDRSILITNKEGVPYEWGKDVIECCYPDQPQEDGLFLLVKYNDNTWSLCHAEKGPMSGATRIPETKENVCPIKFNEDFMGDCEYMVDNHMYDYHEERAGCFKKAIAGLFALGVMLVCVEGIFNVWEPADNKKGISEKQEQQNNKEQPTQNKEEKHIDCQKDTCMIIKSATKAVIQDVISGFRTRG